MAGTVFKIGSMLCLIPCLSCTMIHHEVETGELVEEVYQLYQIEAQSGSTGQTPQMRSDVLDRFGPPHKFGFLDEGRYAFAYEYRNVTERQIGFSVPGYSIFKVGAGKTGAGRYALLIEFDESDHVVAAGAANWHEDVGFGFNLQLFFAVAPTSDTRGILERWSAEEWATDLLNTPVAFVDLSHDSDAGDSGLRLSGMPKPELQWPADRTGKR